MNKITFPHFFQSSKMDCGPTCIRIIAKYYGKIYSTNFLRDRYYVTREGASLLGLSDAAESIGFKSMGVQVSYNQLKNNIPLLCILHWTQNHFVVCYDIKCRKGKTSIYISDPAVGLCTYNEDDFKKYWIS